MNEDEAPQTPAEIRAMAEQAEAEAAEAEALAAAARARSRAIQLRRQAERVEAESRDAAEGDAKEETAAAEEDTAESGPTEVAPAPEVESESAELESAEPQNGPDGASESSTEPVADTLGAEESAPRGSRLSRVRRPNWSTVAACLAIIVSLAALAGSAYMIKSHIEAGQRRARAAEFAAAARQGVVTMTSLDFHDAKQGVQRILDNATGAFREDFLKTADDFVKVVEQSKVVSQGTVQVTAVDRDTMTNDSATVLVASTQEVTNAAGAKQDPRNYRLIVTVARDGGQLKIAKIEFVP